MAKTQEEATKAITAAAGKGGNAFENIESAEPAAETDEQLAAAGTAEAEGAEAGEAQELIDGKFRSLEDVLKAYHESQKELTVKSQESSTTRQELEEAKRVASAYAEALAAVSTMTPQAPAQKQPTPEEQNQELMNQLFSNPAQAIDTRVNSAVGDKLARLEGTLNVILTDMQARQALKDEYDEYVPALVQAYQMFPQLLGRPDGLKTALTIADGLRKNELLEKVRASATQTAVADVQAKKNGETLPSAGGGPSGSSQIDPDLYDHYVKILTASGKISRAEAEERARKSRHVKKGR